MKGTRATPVSAFKVIQSTFMYSCKHKQQYKYFNNKKFKKKTICHLLF